MLAFRRNECTAFRRNKGGILYIKILNELFFYFLRKRGCRRVNGRKWERSRGESRRKNEEEERKREENGE